MRSRDPDAKRRMMLEAALAEFSEYGVAGARIDRLAKRAGISAGHVYSFYDGKEGLFQAVYDSIVEHVVDGTPIDAENLPEYAGALFDLAAAHPDVMKFLAWYALEKGNAQAPMASVAVAMADKIAAIERAQSAGAVTADLKPQEVLALVLVLANAWQGDANSAAALVPADSRRAVVVESVRKLLDPRI